MLMERKVATLGGMICFAIQARYGLGKHREFISDDDHRTFSKIGFLQGLISDTGAIALLKISIALSLLRLSADGKRWYSILLWGLIGTPTPLLLTTYRGSSLIFPYNQCLSLHMSSWRGAAASFTANQSLASGTSETILNVTISSYSSCSPS